MQSSNQGSVLMREGRQRLV